jgi:uncharacterized cupin superfamily protein
VNAPNVFGPEFDSRESRTGFASRRARVGRQAAAEHLGASVYELEPGSAAFPYHYHFANEELLVVLRGRPRLRTPSGWRQLDEGEVVAFPVGERGAHQIVNSGDEPVRVLIVSEMKGPEVTVYPDSDKIGAREQPPGSRLDGITVNFRTEHSVDYWEGEQPPEVTT